MSDRPTLYLSNWSSHRMPGMHGPGRKLSIMARTPFVPDGIVGNLRPSTRQELADLSTLVDCRRRKVDPPSEVMPRYRGALEARWTGYDLSPLRLAAVVLVDDQTYVNPVRNGDTLCCACSVAESRAGRCHRAWAAPFLARAGWRVILDGVEVPHV